MMDDERFAPRRHLGVMVCSTFADLKEHRAALMKAIEAQGFYPEAMEHDAARPGGTDVDSSLQKVRDAAAYIGVISHKYGQIPESADGNPDGFSLTELEFREARRLGRPMLIFIMGDDHDVKPNAVERDPDKIRKLEAFRDEVKRAAEGSRLHRVYATFNSLGEFEVAAERSVAELRRFLDGQLKPAPSGRTDGTDDIPRPPALYAEPRYIGSHAFVGRAAELATLSGWAAPAEPNPILLFEAIGGAGKSMLTWEWTVNHASAARADWAGTFWYSFYEKGAVMADFCRRALAYMTGRPLSQFRGKRQPELSGLLLRQLQARPWLLVLDGLERVLVAYQRYDAAQVADEEAGHTDEIARRDPAAAIRPLDDELLHALAGASPSKVLITSRLVPQVLLNRAGQPIPGVRYERLAGLRPADAEALLRASGVHGDSRLIQDYLRRHCDCHPLVTGVVAGLVQDYLPARGNFDAWAADPGDGGRLNLGELDLVQKRNHILESAVAALPDKDRQLLSTLALLSEAVDYDLLAALNPHLPPERRVRSDPEQWDDDADTDLLEPDEPYMADREEYERERRAWLESAHYQDTLRVLAQTVRNLERRGLLQYDRPADRYDLHPVVRGYAAGRLAAEDRDSLGQRVVDYFSQQSVNPYEEAETLDDVRNGLQVVRTLLQMGRMSSAYEAFTDLSGVLLYRLEAGTEVISLLRPFVTRDWTSPVGGIDDRSFSHLATYAAEAFQMLGQLDQSLAVHEAAVKVDLKLGDLGYLSVDLSEIARVLAELNSLARSDRCVLLELELTEYTDDDDRLFHARFDQFLQLAETGRWAEAGTVWQQLERVGLDHSTGSYVLIPKAAYARARFWQGHLTEDLLAEAEQRARSERDRFSVRSLHGLRGEWRLEQGEWALAADSLHEAIRMTREVGLEDIRLEVLHALARFRLGQLPAAHQEASRLSAAPDRAQLAVAEFWEALGDTEQAARHALTAYRWAWADGEPYVHAYELARAQALLKRLGAEIPRLPGYDPAQAEPLAFEDQVRAAIREQHI
jgi:hypothetical protein